jgi:hypothetical protein
MKPIYRKNTASGNSAADQKLLTNAITLIALGLSIFILNSWDSLFVRTSVGLFWGTFMLILNWTYLVQTFRRLKQKNDGQRHSGYPSSV